MNKKYFSMGLFLGVFFLAASFGIGEGKSIDDEGWEEIGDTVTKETLEEINARYVRDVKPIFVLKCLDCHGQATSLPWYARIPGVQQWIQDDIKDAQEHMDMRNDFPFVGHGTAKDDLEAVARTVRENSMPLWSYRIMHWNSSLTDEDKKKIEKWIQGSLKIINQQTEIEEKK